MGAERPYAVYPPGPGRESSFGTPADASSNTQEILKLSVDPGVVAAIDTGQALSLHPDRRPRTWRAVRVVVVRVGEEGANELPRATDQPSRVVEARRGWDEGAWQRLRVDKTEQGVPLVRSENRLLPILRNARHRDHWQW